MTYDFKNLSWADFEELVRDLVGRELGVRFEAFGVGPDGGMDGRHAAARQTTILQVKHYAGSPFSSLKGAMKRERLSIEKLSPSRYVLATSRALSGGNKRELAGIIGGWLQRESDIFGPGDLNRIIRENPNIEKSHIKLWLSSSAVLERIFKSAAHTFNNIRKSEIETKVRVYASNPSFDAAWQKLDAHHVLIISGPPGVGKTTLAEMLTYAYMAEDWQMIAIRSIDDALSDFDETKKQIFFFDDFLGTIALDRRTLSQKDSDLARLIKRIRRSPKTRFILTTRAYIFEEARHVSEHLADKRLDVNKYVLDVGIYTRRIKARILYNHLLISKTPKKHIASLLDSGDLPKIVDHKNYNPRIIEWMTEIERIESVNSEDYPREFMNALDNPGRLWDVAFRTHISRASQHLLIALFFCPEFAVEIGQLKEVYEAFHTQLSAKYGVARTPKDFEDALKILESGFIEIFEQYVRFVNPSLRDYLSEYLNDIDMLKDFVPVVPTLACAQDLWQHGLTLDLSSQERQTFALAFKALVEKFLLSRVWFRTNTGMQKDGLSNSERIEILIELWDVSKDSLFASAANKLADNPIDGGFDSWLDGERLPELIARLRTGGFKEMPNGPEMSDQLEEHLRDIIKYDMHFEDIERIADAVEKHQESLDNTIEISLRSAIEHEINEADRRIEDMDSESSLDEHIERIQTLGTRIGLPPTIIEYTINSIEERRGEIEAREARISSPNIGSISRAEPERLDDHELNNLFAPLALE